MYAYVCDLRYFQTGHKVLHSETFDNATDEFVGRLDTPSSDMYKWYALHGTVETYMIQGEESPGIYYTFKGTNVGTKL